MLTELIIIAGVGRRNSAHGYSRPALPMSRRCHPPSMARNKQPKKRLRQNSSSLAKSSSVCTSNVTMDPP